MKTKCTYLQGRREIVGVDEFTVNPEIEDVHQECLRPEDHEGPHLIRRPQRVGGGFVAWQEDLCSPGTCEEGCDSEDPMDNCLVYWVVSTEEAQRLIDDANYEGGE